MSGRGKGSKRSLQDLYEHREEYKNLKWEMSAKRKLAKRKKMSEIPLAEIRGWCRKKYGIPCFILSFIFILRMKHFFPYLKIKFRHQPAYCETCERYC